MNSGRRRFSEVDFRPIAKSAIGARPSDGLDCSFVASPGSSEIWDARMEGE